MDGGLIYDNWPRILEHDGLREYCRGFMEVVDRGSVFETLQKVGRDQTARVTGGIILSIICNVKLENNMII